MTAKNRTSSRNKRPGVYVDQTAAAKESHTMFVKQERARKFAALRLSQNKGAVVAAAAAAAANPMLPLAPVVAAAVAAVTKGSKSASDEAEEEGEEDDAAAAEDESVAGDADADADGDAAGALSSTSADGLTVSFQPFVAVDSSTVAATTESSLKDEKVLGVALYEWLLTKQDWDCHTLWERFMRDWDLITETERPPGTNRPINLHGYLTYLRATNNKATMRRDVRVVRETLLAERVAYLDAHPEDPRARPNLEALNGTLLSYYLKVKNLVPYESEAQQKRKEAKRKRMEEARKAKEEEGEGEGQGQAEGGDADPDAVVEAKPAAQPKKKKGKFVHPSAKTAAPAASPAPPTSSLRMGQANSFAALLDCD